MYDTILLHLTPELHRDLSALAEGQGRSVEQLCLAVLSIYHDEDPGALHAQLSTVPYRVDESTAEQVEVLLEQGRIPLDIAQVLQRQVVPERRAREARTPKMKRHTKNRRRG